MSMKSIRPTPTPGAAGTRIIVEPPLLTITGAVTFHVPETASFLEPIVEDERHRELGRILEIGTQTLATVQASTTLRLVEAQLEGLSRELGEKLGALLTSDREEGAKQLRELLDDHRGKVTTALTRYLDPESAASLPTVMAKLFSDATTGLSRRVEVLLSEGDDSALGKLATRFTRELKESTTQILERMAARNALTTQSALAGRPFEEALEARLTEITRPLGDTVTRSADTLGRSRQRVGDLVITIDPATVGGRSLQIVVEAKRRGETAQGFALPAIHRMLDQARKNRGAQAGLLVVEAAAALPHGIGFHELSSTELAVAYTPGESDLGLAVGLRLLRRAVLADALPAADEAVDTEAGQRIVSDLRRAITQLADTQTQHQSAINAIQRASVITTRLEGEVLAGLDRLDKLFVR
ncbi:MAG: hypothetical protein M0Z47_04110 [Actinomycetota bacterium]|nr:hypothetical protein [Actinomycetota bacterium]